jgi:hypothetical protein
MPVATITCQNCGNHFEGKYCNRCGEKVYTDHDRSMVHVIEEGAHFITHFEGTFFKTLRTIFTRPGQLSLDYCRGVRKPYFKPLSFFLLLVVLYLIFPAFQGLNQKLYYHVRSNYYGEFAMKRMIDLARSKSLTDAQLGDLFHARSEKVSKFLLVLLIPLHALVLWALTARKRKYFFDQFILSTEINSFLLLGIFLLFSALLRFLLFLLSWMGFPMDIPDDILGLISNLIMAVFLVAAFRRFYGFGIAGAIVRAVLYLLGSYVMINIVYKFLLFLVTWLLIR